MGFSHPRLLFFFFGAFSPSACNSTSPSAKKKATRL
jgi:hypothetical protein